MAHLLVVLAALVASAAGSVHHHCPAPRAPQNGVQALAGDGGEVRYTCNPGYELRGAPRAWCFNGRWSFPAPVCLPVAHRPQTHPVAGNDRGNQEEMERRARGDSLHYLNHTDSRNMDSRSSGGSYSSRDSVKGGFDRTRNVESRPTIDSYRYQESRQGNYDRSTSRDADSRTSGGRYNSQDSVKGGSDRTRNVDSRPTIEGYRHQESRHGSYDRSTSRDADSRTSGGRYNSQDSVKGGSDRTRNLDSRPTIEGYRHQESRQGSYDSNQESRQGGYDHSTSRNVDSKPTIDSYRHQESRQGSYDRNQESRQGSYDRNQESRQGGYDRSNSRAVDTKSSDGRYNSHSIWNQTSSRRYEARPSGGTHRSVDLGQGRTSPRPTTSDRYRPEESVKGGRDQTSSRHQDSRPIQGIKNHPDETRGGWEDEYSRNVGRGNYPSRGGTYDDRSTTTERINSRFDDTKIWGRGEDSSHRNVDSRSQSGIYSRGSTDSIKGGIKENPSGNLELRRTDSQTSQVIKEGYESDRHSSRPVDNLNTGDIDRRGQGEYRGRGQAVPSTHRPTVNPYDQYRSQRQQFGARGNPSWEVSTSTHPPISVAVRVYPTRSVWHEDNRRGQPLTYMSEDDILNKELERQIGESPYRQENIFNPNIVEKTREPVNEEWLNRLSPELRERFLAKLEYARRHGNDGNPRIPSYTPRPASRPSSYSSSTPTYQIRQDNLGDLKGAPYQEKIQQEQQLISSSSTLRTRSCNLSSTRPPFVRNAYVVKYLIPRGGPLHAVYNCIDNFRLANPSNDRLICQNGVWNLSNSPVCVRAV